MGITTPLDARNLSLPIGSKEVHPIDMAGAAAVLANGGIRHRPYFIDRVTDRHGNVIYEHQSPGRQVVSRQSACLATEVLEANVRAGTGTAAAAPERRPSPARRAPPRASVTPGSSATRRSWPPRSGWATPRPGCR